MLYVVNYRGRQVHGTAPLHATDGEYLIFTDNAVADVDAERVLKGNLRFVAEGDDGHVPAGTPTGSEITVTDVAADGTIHVRHANTSAVKTPDGKHTVNLGDPGAAQRGIQIGSGNIQVNRF